MPLKIEDYALIGDCHTGALVGNDGSIDWLCFPRFDSPSMFGALLGDEDHGRWLIAPVGDILSTSRRYLDNTFILVTRWVTPTGEVEVMDLMPFGDRRADVLRRITGISGTVRMRQELRIRFGYAAAIPWVRQIPEEGDNAIVAVAGPDAVVVRGPRLTAHDHAHVGEFVVSAGEAVDVSLTWYPSHRGVPPRADFDQAIQVTADWWNSWADATDVRGAYREVVQRSLLVLRALTDEDTGGIAAAATTSLPEQWGGVRNWDYRFVWLRDASATVEVMLSRGFTSEIEPWRGWLLRAIAGDPADIQIMYGLAGERELTELTIDSLPGYGGAAPVRRGNLGFEQYQGDIFGETMLALHKAREVGIEEDQFSWPLQRTIMSFVELNWQRPDHGIWEIRGPLRDFTHSRAMIWAAFDCAIKAVRDYGLDGPVERWEVLREEVRSEIEEHGFDASRGTYTQYYGSDGVDASLLQLAQIGYLAADDPRMLGTVAAIEEELLHNGLLLRYRTERGVDGLPPGEHPFLACSFWLAEQYALSGRLPDAITLMDRLVGFCNDVGLLSEEYDTDQNRQAGNTPQALSHLALVRAAGAISSDSARARENPCGVAKCPVSASWRAPSDPSRVSDVASVGRVPDTVIMAELSRAERRTVTRLRLASQLISAPRPNHREPADVVRWMTAMQAQDFLGAKWAVGLRLPGTVDADIDRALANGSIVRSWPMRGTLHFVAPEDLGWMLTLSEQRMVQRASAVHAAEGLTSPLLERAREAAVENLSGGRSLTRGQLHTVFESVGVSGEGQARYHTLWFLSQTGTLCLGPPREKQQTFVLLDEWVPHPRRLERDESLGELARRYFHSHGPATLRDFAWWSSLTLTDARLGLAVARSDIVGLEFADTTFYLSPDATANPAPSGTRILPGFDEYLLGYQDRSATLAAEHVQRVFPGKNGMFLPTIVHDGAIVGTWKRTAAARRVTVTPSPFLPLSGAAASGFTQAAAEYADYLGLPLRVDA